MNVEVSVREQFCQESKGWESYITWIQLPHLSQVRTMDSALNPCVEKCGNWPITFKEVQQTLVKLPQPKENQEYIQLKANISDLLTIPKFPGFRFLGIDLADETHTSSILNCGPWEGKLKDYLPNLNEFGLLDLESARKIREILPDEWNEDAHSFVDIWAIYEKNKSYQDGGINSESLRSSP